MYLSRLKVGILEFKWQESCGDLIKTQIVSNGSLRVSDPVRLCGGVRNESF